MILENRVKGERIYFRNLNLEDASKEYCSWLNDPKVNYYLETRKATVEDLKDYIKEKNKKEDCLFFGIFDIKDNTHIGNIKLEPIDFVEKKAELSLIIGNMNYWGKGIGTEATNLLVNLAFKKLNLLKVGLGVISENKRAIIVYKKAGFKVIKIEKNKMKHGSKFFDKVIMEIQKKENNMKFIKSKELLEEAKKIIPSAAQTYSKSYKYFVEGAAPAFLERGEKGHVWDVDGNEYIDFVLGLGPITIGYNNKEINEAIFEQLKYGISFSQPTILELKLAKKLIEIIPCAEMVKFLKNGSDATTAAIRLARAYTNRDIIACCGYHGYHDWYVGTRDKNVGIPNAIKNLTKTFRYNDIDTLKKLFDKYPNQISAVIIEPCQENGPRNNFLRELKKITNNEGAILIFDEVVSGFRISLGGAQEKFMVTPDLSTFGKGMGNGLAISALVGKAKIMKLIDQGAFISTTFGGETLSLAGALKTIEILERPNSFKHIIGLGDMWMSSIKSIIKDKQLENTIELCGLSPHCGIVFKNAGKLSDIDLKSVYQQTLIEERILSSGINNFCLEHTKQDIKKFINATEIALDVVKKAIEEDSTKGILKGRRIRPIFKRN
jgi:glutamate-1-semialdehyde aminotransferase/RimJ/RimL family protein N-acetyltransferase